MSAQQVASSSSEQSPPIFKVWADQGTHPPVALDQPVSVIGRREIGVDLSLHAPQVSKLHALVVRDQRRVYLRDLASTNGVHRNGAPVLEAGLSDEDVLRIGSYTLRCDSGFSPQAESIEDNSSITISEDLVSDVPPAVQLCGPAGEVFPFPPDRQTLLIGRREGCDVRLDDPSVAPVHAIVFQLAGTRYVRELGKPGRTLLNGRAIHQHALTPGDEIGPGSVRLRYEMTGVEAEPPLEEPTPSFDEIEAAAGIVSIEDSQAAGTPDVGLDDSNLIEPVPVAEASFHGEVVSAGESRASGPQTVPIVDDLPPTFAQREDELIDVPSPRQKFAQTNTEPPID